MFRPAQKETTETDRQKPAQQQKPHSHISYVSNLHYIIKISHSKLLHLPSLPFHFVQNYPRKYIQVQSYHTPVTVSDWTTGLEGGKWNGGEGIQSLTKNFQLVHIYLFYASSYKQQTYSYLRLVARLYGLTIFCARQQVSLRGMQDDMHF